MHQAEELQKEFWFLKRYIILEFSKEGTIEVYKKEWAMNFHSSISSWISQSKNFTCPESPTGLEYCKNTSEEGPISFTSLQSIYADTNTHTNSKKSDLYITESNSSPEVL